MAVYLHDFTFLSAETEYAMLELEKRTCFNTYYPFHLFPDKGVKRIEFGPITIFYGGNGSGKSTMLNIIATKLGVLRELPFQPTQFFDWYVNGVTRRVYGDPRYDYVDTDVHVDGTSFNSDLPDELKAVPAESRILTSEDVFERTLATRGQNRKIDRLRAELGHKWWEFKIEDKRVNYTSEEGPERDEWFHQKQMKKKSMSAVIRDELGLNVPTGSNGENAFEYFCERIQGHALYLLDEPENSLSAIWQTKLAKLILGMARFEECQFVIATHSPFLLGIGGAKIYDLDTPGTPVRPWTELENVREYFTFFRDRAGEF